MAQTGQYIEMMAESLKKKTKFLSRIIGLNNKIEELATQPEMDMEEFRVLLDEKDDCVTQITQLDNGFETLYDKVHDELQDRKEQFREQILAMQQLIKVITDQVVLIQKAEEKNRTLIESQFSKMKQSVCVAKKGMDVAQNYYKSMSKMQVVDAQFMDKKN